MRMTEYRRAIEMFHAILWVDCGVVVRPSYQYSCARPQQVVLRGGVAWMVHQCRRRCLTLDWGAGPRGHVAQAVHVGHSRMFTRVV